MISKIICAGSIPAVLVPFYKDTLKWVNSLSFSIVYIPPYIGHFIKNLMCPSHDPFSFLCPSNILPHTSLVPLQSFFLEKKIGLGVKVKVRNAYFFSPNLLKLGSPYHFENDFALLGPENKEGHKVEWKIKGVGLKVQTNGLRASKILFTDAKRFELLVRLSTSTFKVDAFDHSAIRPLQNYFLTSNK